MEPCLHDRERPPRAGSGSDRSAGATDARPVPWTAMAPTPRAKPAQRPGRARRVFFGNPRTGRYRTALIAAGVAVTLLVAGCADFSAEQPSFTMQPSLTAPQANPTGP